MVIAPELVIPPLATEPAVRLEVAPKFVLPSLSIDQFWEVIPPSYWISIGVIEDTVLTLKPKAFPVVVGAFVTWSVSLAAKPNPAAVIETEFTNPTLVSEYWNPLPLPTPSKEEATVRTSVVR